MNENTHTTVLNVKNGKKRKKEKKASHVNIGGQGCKHKRTINQKSSRFIVNFIIMINDKENYFYTKIYNYLK